MAWRTAAATATWPVGDADHDSMAASQVASVLRAVEHKVGRHQSEQLILAAAGSPSIALTTTVPPAPPDWASANLTEAGNAPRHDR